MQPTAWLSPDFYIVKLLLVTSRYSQSWYYFQSVCLSPNQKVVLQICLVV